MVTSSPRRPLSSPATLSAGSHAPRLGRAEHPPERGDSREHGFVEWRSRPACRDRHCCRLAVARPESGAVIRRPRCCPFFFVTRTGPGAGAGSPLRLGPEIGGQAYPFPLPTRLRAASPARPECAFDSGGRPRRVSSGSGESSWRVRERETDTIRVRVGGKCGGAPVFVRRRTGRSRGMRSSRPLLPTPRRSVTRTRRPLRHDPAA